MKWSEGKKKIVTKLLLRGQNVICSKNHWNFQFTRTWLISLLVTDCWNNINVYPRLKVSSCAIKSPTFRDKLFLSLSESSFPRVHGADNVNNDPQITIAKCFKGGCNKCGLWIGTNDMGIEDRERFVDGIQFSQISPQTWECQEWQGTPSCDE